MGQPNDGQVISAVLPSGGEVGLTVHVQVDNASQQRAGSSRQRLEQRRQGSLAAVAFGT
jgi:hypothetical protein